MVKIQRYLLKPGLVLFACIALSTLLGACSFNANNSHEVVYWTSVADDIDMAAQNQIVANFEKLHPDLHVTIVPEPAQFTGDATSLITSVRGGTPPDVYLVDRFTVSQLASIGLLTNLNPFIQKDDPNLSQNYEPFAWGETLYQNSPYALPMDTDARAMYYNKDLIKKAGIDPSIFDPSHGPMTIDQVMSFSQKLAKTDSKGNYTQLGLIPWSGQAFHATWILDFGGKYFNPQTCQMTTNEPAIMETYQGFQKWAEELNYSKVATYLATYQPPNAPPSETPFFTNNLALSIDGNWTLASIQQYAPKLNYGVTYVPVQHAGDKPFTWSGGFGLVMPSGAHNSSAGYQFMKYMSGPAGQRVYTKVTSHLPTWTSLLSDKSLINGNQAFFASLLKYSMSRPPLPVGAQISDAMDTAQQGVLLGDTTPQQAVQQIQNRVEPQMQESCPFKLSWTNPRAH